MVRLACLLRVTAAAAALGLLLVGAAFRFLDADHSNAAVAVMTPALCVLNFQLLRRGLRGSTAPARRAAPRSRVPVPAH